MLDVSNYTTGLSLFHNKSRSVLMHLGHREKISNISLCLKII